MAPALQARLLRVIQDRSITPLGGDTARPVDIAIICATHCDLRSLAGKGLFREDLYYRLNGITIALPPLRQRSDLAALIRRILAELCGGQLQHEVSGPLMRVFERYAWPGNLRQLHHVLEVGLAMLDNERVIDLCHLQDDFLADIDASPLAGETREAAEPCGDTPDSRAAGRAGRTHSPSSLKLLETTAILQALQDNDGNVSAAARQLGIGRVTIYRKLKQQEA
jgi:transcriptional regulator of acetoin/glycerol metabolism